MFKFVFSCQPLYYYIHKVLKRCPTERYIKPVRIPGYLCFEYDSQTALINPFFMVKISNCRPRNHFIDVSHIFLHKLS